MVIIEGKGCRNAMLAVAILQAIIAYSTAYAAQFTSTLTRDRDPVVITGSQLPDFNGIAPGRIVGFRFRNTWQQIPVQIDERKYVDFAQVYNYPPQLPVGVEILSYTDPNTYVGPDNNPNFDSNDELVFMSKDTGDRAFCIDNLPESVLPATGLELEIRDTLDNGEGFVYLFQTDGNLTPDANQDYVSYTFDLLAGEYPDDYDLAYGPNPENSQAASIYYRTHFSDRWVCNELNIFAGSSTGDDILDRHKNMFAPGNCTRTENTFSNGEGAFFVNKDGPVRAIRSYMGANSGPVTQREHLFYQQRQDVTTFLRVHAISGVMDLYDYSPDAGSMTYYNNLNQSGVTVDGQPESLVAGPLAWEMVTGRQGTLVISHSIYTDINPFTYTSYYSDDITPGVTQCTGDNFEYATSGQWINHNIPNTDPYLVDPNVFNAKRTVYYEEPNQLPSIAATRHQQAQTPLQVTVYPFLLCPADLNNNGNVDVRDWAVFAQNWLNSGCTYPDWCNCADLNRSATVDTQDLDALSENWLWSI